MIPDLNPVPATDPGIHAAARALATRDGHVLAFLTPAEQGAYLETAHIAINAYESSYTPKDAA